MSASTAAINDPDARSFVAFYRRQPMRVVTCHVSMRAPLSTFGQANKGLAQFGFSGARS